MRGPRGVERRKRIYYMRTVPHYAVQLRGYTTWVRMNGGTTTDLYATVRRAGSRRPRFQTSTGAVRGDRWDGSEGGTAIHPGEVNDAIIWIQ